MWSEFSAVFAPGISVFQIFLYGAEMWTAGNSLHCVSDQSFDIERTQGEGEFIVDCANTNPQVLWARYTKPKLHETTPRPRTSGRQTVTRSVAYALDRPDKGCDTNHHSPMFP
ncbi:unnamed protein product [Leptidea sinapis]|uniref:Uncharacterized protein n=1 Tax=Leptidea sinapis TaxID=189913 RepID=A0A5E4Q7T5_9NEOP|nr:unnamed protein product [Leptidea sinapis]